MLHDSEHSYPITCHFLKKEYGKQIFCIIETVVPMWCSGLFHAQPVGGWGCHSKVSKKNPNFIMVLTIDIFKYFMHKL